MIEVATIDELSLMAVKAGHVDYDDSHQRTRQLARVDVVHQVVDYANPVELVAVNRCCQPEDRTIAPPPRHQHREQDVLGEAIGDQVDIEPRHLPPREILDDELAIPENGAGHTVAKIAFHLSRATLTPRRRERTRAPAGR